MSLLSSDSLLLYLTPDKVQAVHLRGWRSHIVGLHQLPVTSESSDDWQAVLETALRLVKTLAPNSVRILLSDQLVRYSCFPWRDALRNEAEELAFAKLAFEDTYGAESSVGWRMSFSNEAPGLNRLVAAVPEGLIAGLQLGLAQAKVRLTSVRPQLVAAVQAFSKSLPKVGWIMSHEPGRLSIAGWDASGWHWVGSNRMGSDAPQMLVLRLQQELMLAGAWPAATESPILVSVFGPTLPARDWVAVDGLQFTPWVMPANVLTRLEQKTDGALMTESAIADFSQALMGVLA